MDSVLILTRSMTPELTQLAEQFLSVLPFQRVHIKDSTADFYFYGMHSFEADWIINIDEDAFCFAPQRLLSLMEYMKANDYHFCGMPDGGLLPIRQHNPVVPNAFFNIFNLKAIRPLFDVGAVMSTVWDTELESFTSPLATGVLSYDEFEPYYRYFFWLLKSGFRPLYLEATTWEQDGTATVLKNHLGEDFLIHAWYAREFQTNPERFLRIVRYALGLFHRPSS